MCTYQQNKIYDHRFCSWPSVGRWKFCTNKCFSVCEFWLMDVQLCMLYNNASFSESILKMQSKLMKIYKSLGGSFNRNRSCFRERSGRVSMQPNTICQLNVNCTINLHICYPKYSEWISSECARYIAIKSCWTVKCFVDFKGCKLIHSINEARIVSLQLQGMNNICFSLWRSMNINNSIDSLNREEDYATSWRLLFLQK